MSHLAQTLKLAVTSAALLLTGCQPPAAAVPRAGKDLTTLASPDGRFVATVRKVNIDGSVMVSQPYQVLVASDSYGRHELGVALLADKSDAPVVRWVGPSSLMICYQDANILHFRNHFYSTNQDGSAVVEAEVVLTKQQESNPCESPTKPGA